MRNCLEEDDPMGINYRGTRNVSSRQVPCQNWDDLGEWNKFHPSHYPNADLTGNYCRNPDNDKMGPWCFIAIRPNRKFQYCKIRTCQYSSVSIVDKTGVLGTEDDPYGEIPIEDTMRAVSALFDFD